MRLARTLLCHRNVGSHAEDTRKNSYSSQGNGATCHGPLSIKATRAQHVQRRAPQKISAEGPNRIHLHVKTQMGRARSEKRRWTVDAGNDRLVSERREKTARKTPNEMGQFNSRNCGAGLSLVNRGQRPAQMENVGIRTLNGLKNGKKLENRYFFGQFSAFSALFSGIGHAFSGISG